MNKFDEIVVKLIGVVGWILVGLGALFTVWAFIKIFLDAPKNEPLLFLFFFTLIFCSIACGLFFVVLNIVVKILHNIERNTSRQKDMTE